MYISSYVEVACTTQQHGLRSEPVGLKAARFLEFLFFGYFNRKQLQ